MSQTEIQSLLQRVFAALFDPAVSAEQVGRFFSPDYVQESDGKRLDYAAFLAHVRAVKASIAQGHVTLEKLLVDGRCAATLHIVELQKTDGAQVRLKVLAWFEFKDGLLCRTAELSHVLQGAAQDRDFASRS